MPISNGMGQVNSGLPSEWHAIHRRKTPGSSHIGLSLTATALTRAGEDGRHCWVWGVTGRGWPCRPTISESLVTLFCMFKLIQV